MFANISWPQLLIILVIVLAIFGTKRLRTRGSDLGRAETGFRGAMKEAEEEKDKLEDDTKEDANFENTPVDEPRKNS